MSNIAYDNLISHLLDEDKSNGANIPAITTGFINMDCINIPAITTGFINITPKTSEFLKRIN